MTLLFQSKAIIFGAAIFLFFYVNFAESKAIEIAGCYDCSWETRQAFYLFLASAGLLFNRFWASIISLLLTTKVFYSVGYVTFWNDLGGFWNNSGLGEPGIWQKMRGSLQLTYEFATWHFIEIFLAVIITSYAIAFIRRDISQNHLDNQTATN